MSLLWLRSPTRRVPLPICFLFSLHNQVSLSHMAPPSLCSWVLAPSTLQEWLPPSPTGPSQCPIWTWPLCCHFLPTSTSTEHPFLRNVFDIMVWSFPCLDNDALLSLHCPSSFLPHNHLRVAPGLTQESCASLLPLYLQQNSGHGRGRGGGCP